MRTRTPSDKAERKALMALGQLRAAHDSLFQVKSLFLLDKEVPYRVDEIMANVATLDTVLCKRAKI